MAYQYPSVPNPGESEPIVFLDVTLGGEPLGRIKIHIFTNSHPKTSENFRQFCTGEYRSAQTGKPTGYKTTKFHRIVKGFVLQGGDIPSLAGTPVGTGSLNIYRGTAPFADEPPFLPHSKPGLLSMANSGKDTNGCQFFITLAPAAHLDGKHVVFGQVADEQSLGVVRKLENVRVQGQEGKPAVDVRIAQCGEM